MAEAKWTGILSTTEPRNDIGILNVRQGNVNSETVEFQIIQNNKPYDLTGSKVYFCTNYGLAAVEKSAVIKDAKNGIITFVFNSQSMQEVGRQVAYFQITKDEVLIASTQDFEFRVQSSILTRKMEGGSYIESFENILETLGDNAAYELAAELDRTNEQLAQTAKKNDLPAKRDKSELIGVNDLDETTLGYLKNGVGGAIISLENIPKDYSVTFKKTDFLKVKTEKDVIVDIIPPTLGELGIYYDPASGNPITNGYTLTYKATGKLNIGGFTTFDSFGVTSWIFYTSANVKISSKEINEDASVAVAVPSNAAYMIGNVRDFYFPLNDPNRSPYPKGVAKATISTKEYKYNMDELVVESENLSEDLKNGIAASVPNRYKSKIIVNFGDSIIENKDPSISEFISKDLGATVINAGFGGCMMCPHPNAEYAKFSMTAIADAVVSGDWSLQENATGIPASFKATVAILKKIDWTKVSFITISYGTNDWLNSNLLDDTVNKFNKAAYLGASRYSLKTIMQKYPYLKVLITPPIFRSTNDRTENSDNWKNGKNIYMKDYADGLINMGKELKIPVADTFYGLGINGWNESYYFPANDGTHPNAIGRQLLGQKIANTIRYVY